MVDFVKRYFAPAFVALFVTVLFVVLRTHPSYKLWKGYTVLSVPRDSDDVAVSNALLEAGCLDVISLSAQRGDAASALESILLQNALGFDSYEKGRSLYFFDRDGKARLYYVPDAHKNSVKTATELLERNYRISALLDSGSSFPWMVPIVVLAVFAAFLWLSENRIVFAAAAVFPVAFCFCNPLHAAGAAASIEIYAIFLAQKVWRRRGGTEFLLKNWCLWIFCAASLLASFATGFVGGILFLLNFVASASALFLLLNLEEEYERRFPFVPILIRDAKMVGRMNRRSVKGMSVCSCAAFLLLVLFLTGANFSSGKGGKDLYFPAPKVYNDKPSEFASLDDFFVRRWNALSLEYRPLAEISLANAFARPSEGDVVTQTRYEKRNGEIYASEQVVCTYDEAFRKKEVASVLNADYPALEKLWLAQGRKFSTEYASGGSGAEGGEIAVAVLLAAMFLPLFVAFYFILIWRKVRNVL